MILICSRDGKLSLDLGRLDLSQLEPGLEWEERREGGLEEPSFVSVAGYLYTLAGGDPGVHRFSVMIGVWGQADPVQ